MSRGPLERRVLATLERRRFQRGGEGSHPTLATADEAAELLGVTSRTWNRWAHDGLSALTADRAANALGTHPGELWGAEWRQAIGCCDTLSA